MPYIKKLVMHGFKSFVRKTEVPFASGINVILGPNGSGKSNISDAICFVLGRLNTKSLRASKAKNLIFMGTKNVAPAKEAVVEIIFDNSDKIFSIEGDEVSIKRIVRKNGLGVYKINGETRTRQEVLSLLAQAEIDPNGFNIVLQGEIQNFARMHAEERRKVIEEVAGISIYESRKEKSLKELEKTEEKLKEVMAILKERTAYLNNLERERQQALRYKKIEQDVKKFKASIIYHDLSRKKKEIEKINSDISDKDKEIEKVKKLITGIRTSVENLRAKIESINSTIQKSTGFEQEKLNREIADIRAEIAGMRVKAENYETKIYETSKLKHEFSEKIRNDELSVKELQKESPAVVKKEKELSVKKHELEKLEEQRKKFYMTKSELRSIKERIQDKKNILQNYLGESESLLGQIKSISMELFDSKTTREKLDKLKLSLAEKKDLLEGLNKKEIELEKKIHMNECEISRQEKLMEKISGMDVCPLCKNKITEAHIHSIKVEASPKINEMKREVEGSDKQLNELYNHREILKRDIEQIGVEIYKRDSDLVKLANIEEKKDRIKLFQEKIEEAKAGLAKFEKEQKNLEANFDENSNIEHKYETLRMEVQEISLRNEETITSEISFKQKELERMKISLKQFARDEEDFNEELGNIKKNLEIKESLLQKKNKQEEELSRKFKEMISERDKFHDEAQKHEIEVSMKQNVIHNFEREINDYKIDKARVGAEIENLEIEMLEFSNVEIIKTNRESLVEKLVHAKEMFSSLGSVNLRSLEVYDSIKKEYDVIQEKVNMVIKEKEGIFKIIHEIDIKKKKTFLNTMNQLNTIFSNNFSQLSIKGQEVTLELENKKDPFDGGVSIIVKTGHGKYFDVTSLSGGEQTLVALSLIFAIQELNPYCFYLLDEIDAALDKRNSERLAMLLKKYMKKGQYVVITHNDEIITNATTLYGISMHEGVSKITSLRV